MTLIKLTTFPTDPGLHISNQDPWGQPALLSHAINEQRASRPKRIEVERKADRNLAAYFDMVQ